MHWYHTALLIGALIAAGLAWHVPRAVTWVALGALSFIASGWWHDAGFSHGAAFGAFTNLLMCLALYAWAEQRWELRVWNVFHLMILIDILFLAGFIKNHYTFAVSIEVANWLAIFVIGAAGITDRARRGNSSRALGHGWAGAFDRALHEERKYPPFWRA